MDADVGNLVGEEIEQEIEIQLLRLERRGIRDRSNPFEIPDSQFKQLYRFPKQLAVELIEQMEPFLLEEARSTSIPNNLKVLCALHFYAHGSYQKSVGQDFFLGLSQTSVSRCIKSVSHVIYENLGARYMQFPSNEERREALKIRFMERFNFPGVIGCIDCTHVAIVSPPLNDDQHPGYAYLNRKGYHSINVQLICDADLRIINCNARYPGSTHDAAIWQMSAAFQALQDNYHNDNVRGTWLLGDSGYPLQPWLLTPIEGAMEDTPEGRYNSAHIRARNVIERCNGVLKSRFRCLLKHRVLHYSPTSAAKIIMSCCILHNILINNNVGVQDEDLVVEVDNPQGNIQAEQPREYLAEARRVRGQLIRNHFL